MPTVPVPVHRSPVRATLPVSIYVLSLPVFLSLNTSSLPVLASHSPCPLHLSNSISPLSPPLTPLPPRTLLPHSPDDHLADWSSLWPAGAGSKLVRVKRLLDYRLHRGRWGADAAEPQPLLPQRLSRLLTTGKCVVMKRCLSAAARGQARARGLTHSLVLNGRQSAYLDEKQKGWEGGVRADVTV